MSHVSDPPANAMAVTISDATIFENPTRGLWIGGAGDLSVRMYGNKEVVLLKGVQVGLLAGQFDQVRAATTCSDIVRVW